MATVEISGSCRLREPEIELECWELLTGKACFPLLSDLRCGPAGGAAVSRLQRTLHVCDGVCGNDLPTGVHVPCHPSAPHLHGVGRAGEVHGVFPLWCPWLLKGEHQRRPVLCPS